MQIVPTKRWWRCRGGGGGHRGEVWLRACGDARSLWPGSLHLPADAAQGSCLHHAALNLNQSGRRGVSRLHLPQQLVSLLAQFRDILTAISQALVDDDGDDDDVRTNNDCKLSMFGALLRSSGTSHAAAASPACFSPPLPGRGSPRPLLDRPPHAASPVLLMLLALSTSPRFACRLPTSKEASNLHVRSGSAARFRLDQTPIHACALVGAFVTLVPSPPHGRNSERRTVCSPLGGAGSGRRCVARGREIRNPRQAHRRLRKNLEASHARLPRMPFPPIPPLISPVEGAVPLSQSHLA